MAIGLKLPAELTHLAPAFKVVVAVLVLLYGNYFGKLTKQQGKSPLGAYDAYRHIVLVKNKHIAV